MRRAEPCQEKYGILILAFVAVQALSSNQQHISSAFFPGEDTIDIVSYAFTFILTLLINVSGSRTMKLYVSEYCQSGNYIH